VATNSNLPFGSVAAEQSDAHAGNGLDVSAYPCVGVAARNRKITESIVLRYVRLPNRRELLIQRARSRLFLILLMWSSLAQHDESVSDVEHS